MDQRESEREQKMKECLESLKRVFSGVHGRLLDLFTPSQRKYAVPVSIILGRNMDAIIVDQQKTAIECIQVFIVASFASLIICTKSCLINFNPFVMTTVYT